MMRKFFFFTGLLFLTLSLAGCRGAGQGGFAQPFNQPQFGAGQSQALGQFGRNIGNRVTNGVINHGINRLITSAF